jgi:hypothetical protein
VPSTADYTVLGMVGALAVMVVMVMVVMVVTVVVVMTRRIIGAVAGIRRTGGRSEREHECPEYRNDHSACLAQHFCLPHGFVDSVETTVEAADTP